MAGTAEALMRRSDLKGIIQDVSGLQKQALEAQAGAGRARRAEQWKVKALVTGMVCLAPLLGGCGAATPTVPVPGLTVSASTAPPAEEPTGGPPTTAQGTNWTRPSDEMTMVYVPGGEFEMGSSEGDSDERPVHPVALDGFWIDRTEVTNAQYRLCVAEGDCDAPAYGDDSDLDRDDTPVVRVDWTDAQAYCAWAGARLPTEAEWAYAARGPEANTYPWGDSFDSTQLNFCDANCEYLHRAPQYDDGYPKAAAVGSFPAGASWCQALDMAGNVWEWVADRYGEYPSGRQVNPTGPSTGAARVMRGGSWSSTALHVRSATRFWFDPELRFVNVGFRCARASD